VSGKEAKQLKNKKYLKICRLKKFTIVKQWVVSPLATNVQGLMLLGY